jgi:SAM-dependent methyltransferase
MTHSTANGPESTLIVTPDGKRLSLDCFVGWGGPAVVQLAKNAFDFLGRNLTGRRVLEIGFGHGQMSCLFALLGAEVLAVDTHDVTQGEASAEAKRWGVTDRIHFARYSGDPRDIEQTGFDIVFTKSVLLLVLDLERFLHRLSTKLRPGAQVAFIENGFHNVFSIAGRRILHWWKNNEDSCYPGVAMYNWRLPVYLSPARLEIFGRVFDVQHVIRANSKHWYLIEGFTRQS